MEAGDLFCLVPLLLLAIGSIVLWVVVRRWAARYRPDETVVADGFADSEGRFRFEHGAGGPLELYLHYTVEAARGRRGAYSMVVLVDVRREPASGGYRGAEAPFELRHEYLLGSARQPLGEAPVGQTLGSGPLLSSGRESTRGVRLARIPAGGPLVVRGRLEVRGGAVCQGFLVFLKPARG